MGHSYGPDSDEYHDALIRVDGYLADILDALPEDTAIAIFADHGTHNTADGGNHGSLIASDLIIPIIFLEK
jgi:predicted AlkP superfamily pyrophosphatase or phosphodiesterase